MTALLVTLALLVELEPLVSRVPQDVMATLACLVLLVSPDPPAVATLVSLEALELRATVATLAR